MIERVEKYYDHNDPLEKFRCSGFYIVYFLMIHNDSSKCKSLFLFGMTAGHLDL